MPFFGKNPPTPAEIVDSLKKNVDHMLKLQMVKLPCEKVAEEVSENLSSLREVLWGTLAHASQTVAQLAQDQNLLDLLITLIKNLQKIDFEARKDVASVFCSLVECTHTVEYIHSHPEILSILVKGYESEELVDICGWMLRACLRHEPLARLVLFSQDFYHLMGLVSHIPFEAFISIKDLLTRQSMSAEFLEANYDKFFEEYEKLLHSDNYLTRRQSLQLLQELLLNVSVMTRYVSNAENLHFMMNLLRDTSRYIQFEAFKVFKVFVAHPNKTQSVKDILLKYQTTLVIFLENFQNDRSYDQQFCNDKIYLIKQICDLRPTTPAREEPNTTAEIVNIFKNTVNSMLNLPTWCEKDEEELSKNLSSLRKVLCGTLAHESQTEAVAQLAWDQELLDLILSLIDILQKIDFQARTDVASVFCSLVEHTYTVDFIRSHPKILFILLKGLKSEESHNCGRMLRACLRHEPLARLVLFSQKFYGFFHLISYEAFISFKDLLTRHESMSAMFLETNCDKFFEEYEKLLYSEDSHTRRQSLQLLGELLLNRHNVLAMTRYISSAENLKSIMQLLRSGCRHIRFHAFKVFKVFVENPNMPVLVLDILLKEKSNLMALLSRTDQFEDEDFCSDKFSLMKKILDLKHPTAPEESQSFPSGRLIDMVDLIYD